MEGGRDGKPEASITGVSSHPLPNLFCPGRTDAGLRVGTGQASKRRALHTYLAHLPRGRTHRPPRGFSGLLTQVPTKRGWRLELSPPLKMHGPCVRNIPPIHPSIHPERRLPTHPRRSPKISWCPSAEPPLSYYPQSS